MTLAQYLAMLEAGGAYQPTPAPPQAQTNINWGAVAGQPLPDPTRAYTYDPIEVTAERLPQTFEQPEMASLPFQELYGGGVREQPASQALAFAPASAPMKLPPLPVKGAAQPRPMANVIDIRPPSMPSDAAPEPTPTYMGATQPGADIAMLADEQPAQQALSPEEEAKRKEQERTKAWRSGQPFDIDLPDYGGKFTVTAYNVDKGSQGIAQTALKIQDAKGTQYEIPYTSETKPIFEAASSAYKTQYDQTAAATAGQEYSSTIVVGGKQLPAKITKDQRGLPTVIYRTESGLPAAYPNFYDLREGETFISPVDMPGALDQAKQERQQFLRELKQSARGVSGNIQSQLTPDQIAARLIPVPGPEPTAKQRESGQFVPGVSYNFVTDTGEIIPVEKAVELGLLQPSVKQALDQSTQERMAEISARAKARQQYQQEKPQTMAEADIERIKTQKAQAETQLRQAKAALAADPNSKDKQDEVKQLTGLVGDLDSNLLSALAQGRSVKGAGGVTITEGGVSKIVESLDPTSAQGALDIYSTGAAPNKAGEIWDMRDVGREAIDNAKQNFPPTGITKDERLERGAQALNARLGEIEQVAVQKMGASAPDILDMPVKFVYISYDENQQGIVTSTTMNLQDAITSASAASRNYQQVMTNPNATMEQRAKAKQDLQVYHQILAGRWDIQFPGDEEPTSFAAGGGLEYLRNTAQYVQATSSPSARVQGTRTATPLERAIAAPPIDVARPPGSGRTPPPVTRVPAFPMIYIGASQTNPSGYVKFDAGFNYFDRTKVNAQTYKEMNDRFQPSNSEGATMRNIAMAAFNEDGNPTSATKQALSKTIDDMNAEIIKDGNEAIRLDFVDIFHKQLQVLGAELGDAPSTMAGELERIRTMAKNGDHAGAQAAVESFRDKYGRQAITKFRNNGELWGRLQALSNNPGAWGTSTAGRWAIEAQIVGAVEDIAYLFKQSGYGDTKVLNRGAGRSTVTWIPNIASDRKQQSVITLPVANTDTTRASVDPRPLAQATADPFDLSTTAQTGQTAILEPTTNRLLIKLDSVRAPMSSLLDKLTQLPSLSALVRQGESNVTGYNRNLKANNTSRPDEDEAVEVTPATQTSIKKYAVGEILLYSMMPSNRIRTYSWFR